MTKLPSLRDHFEFKISPIFEHLQHSLSASLAILYSLAVSLSLVSRLFYNR